MEIVSLLTTTLHPPPWTTPPILTHTHTHTLHIINFSHNQALRLLADIFAFLVSLALMLWSRTHCVFPALYVRVFSPTMSAFFPFFFFFSLPFPSVKKIAFYRSGWSPKSLILNPRGITSPIAVVTLHYLLAFFFGWGGAVTSKDDNKTREEKKRAVWGEEWRGGSSQAVM